MSNTFIEDFNAKYVRIGYCPDGRDCDIVIDTITKHIPGNGVLPPRWVYKNLTRFTSKYSNLGTILWAKTASYHLLVVNGHRLCRVWTDTKHKCLIDIADPLDDGSAFPIPSSTYRKSKPFSKRIIGTEETADKLGLRIRSQYGI